jgi:hypothetical protein
VSPQPQQPLPSFPVPPIPSCLRASRYHLFRALLNSLRPHPHLNRPGVRARRKVAARRRVVHSPLHPMLEVEWEPAAIACVARLPDLRDWFGLASRAFPTTSMTPSPAVPQPTLSPPPDPEPSVPPISTSNPPTIPVDPRTQLLTDMARAFHMGMGLDDGTGTGSRSSSAPGASPPSQSASPAVDVNHGEGQQGQQQPRPPPAEDSFERFLLDLQVDLRRTLEEGQPENEPEPQRGREQEREA